jgi:hypothetical protein
MVMLCEQSAIDGGRLPLALLVSGGTEPSPQLFNTKRRLGLKPFTRLAAPTWIAANLAYLKDIDYLETRMEAAKKQGRGVSGTPVKETSPEADSTEPEGPRRPRRRGGRGNGSAS